MSFGFTNRGKYLILQYCLRNTGWPTNLYAALVKKKSEKSLNAAAAVNVGTGKVGIPVTAHGYAAGAAVYISGTVHYNGRWIVDATSTTDRIVIASLFSSETFTGAEKVHEAPGPKTNTMASLLEIAAGNGYTAGGIELTPGGTDFDVLTQDDTNDRALVQVKDLVWTASGGPIPASGDGARYLVITDDNATLGSRQVLWYGDLLLDRSVNNTEVLTLADYELDLLEVG